MKQAKDTPVLSMKGAKGDTVSYSNKARKAAEHPASCAVKHVSLEQILADQRRKV